MIVQELPAVYVLTETADRRLFRVHQGHQEYLCFFCEVWHPMTWSQRSESAIAPTVKHWRHFWNANVVDQPKWRILLADEMPPGMLEQMQEEP